MPKKNSKKTRCCGEWTDSKYFSFIRSALRRSAMRWKPIRQCKINARRKYAGTNKRQKWEYQCSTCFGWFSDKQTQVDHILPCGQLKSFEDACLFIERLFCELDNLRVLCIECHVIKTNKGN